MSLVDDIVLTFRLDGDLRTLRYRQITFGTWSELKRVLGFTPSTLLDGIAQNDLEAIGAIIWLERRQRERDLPWARVRRELESGDITFEPVRAVVNDTTIYESEPAEAATEDEPDPTVG